MILACDPGLTATAVVLFDEDRDAVVDRATYRFGTEFGDDPDRIALYCDLIHDRFINRGATVFAIEDQKTSLVHSTGSGGRSGGRGLPDAIQAAVDASGAGNAQKRGDAASRGGKNAAMIRLAKLAGALEQVAVEAGLRVVRVLPQEAKRSLTSNPRATKQDMRDWARMSYPTRNEHEDDALGICFGARVILRMEAMG